MSVATPQYKKYILDNVLGMTINLPTELHRTFHPINIDFFSFLYGVGAAGTTGIYALDTALPLEIEAFEATEEELEEIVGRSTDLRDKAEYQEGRAQLKEWETAIKAKYSSVPGIESFR